MEAARQMWIVDENVLYTRPIKKYGCLFPLPAWVELSPNRANYTSALTERYQHHRIDLELILLSDNRYDGQSDGRHQQHKFPCATKYIDHENTSNGLNFHVSRDFTAYF